MARVPRGARRMVKQGGRRAHCGIDGGVVGMGECGRGERVLCLGVRLAERKGVGGRRGAVSYGRA